jgi:hypothetical protein
VDGQEKGRLVIIRLRVWRVWLIMEPGVSCTFKSVARLYFVYVVIDPR